MSENEAEKFMRRRWGTDEQYYKELERFHKQHRNGGAVIEYSNELNCPVKAIYYFEPWQVLQEHFSLMGAIKIACEESDKKREGEL